MEIQEERMRQEAREEQMNVELEEERMRQEPHPGKNKKKKKKSKSKGKAKETMDATPTLGKNGGQENDPKGKGKADQNKEPVQIKEWEYQEPGVNKDGTTMSDEELEAQFASMDAFIREQSGIQNKPEPENVYPTIDLREPGYWDYMLPSRQHPSQTEGTEGPRVDSQACTTSEQARPLLCADLTDVTTIS